MRRAALILTVLATGALAIGPMAPAVATVRADAPVSRGFSPNPSPEYSVLNSVSAISSDDAWAVGNYEIDEATAAQCALVLHWDGEAWSQVDIPISSSTESELLGVSALSSSNVWAVGYYLNEATGRGNALILHWDGLAWSQIDGPFPGSTGSGLRAVDAVADDDVWAVGGYYGADSDHVNETLILHWDGKAWSRVKSPSPRPFFNTVAAVSVASAREAWAVGHYGSDQQGLLLHWDGVAWSKVRCPVPDALLLGVYSESRSNAWAVAGGLILHWNGSVWARSDHPPIRRPYLVDVDGTRPRNVWVVGSSGRWRHSEAVTLRWDGKRWTDTRHQSPDPGSFHFEGGDVRSSTDAWAVGYYVNTSFETLAFHWNGTRWSRT